MEILYYAIISFCLKNCNHIDDMTKYVYYEPVSYTECLETVEKMASVLKKIF